MTEVQASDCLDLSVTEGSWLFNFDHFIGFTTQLKESFEELLLLSLREWFVSDPLWVVLMEQILQLYSFYWLTVHDPVSLVDVLILEEQVPPSVKQLHLCRIKLSNSTYFKGQIWVILSHCFGDVFGLDNKTDRLHRHTPIFCNDLRQLIPFAFLDQEGPLIIDGYSVHGS